MLNKIFSNYKIVEKIGIGGMSNVYLGRNTNSGSLAAVKIIKKQYTQQKDHIERFFTREVEITRGLDHKNIVKLLNYGQKNGTYYLIYEYVPAVSLDRYLIENKKISISNIENISRQILSALAYAHSKGIIHRDIKPQNVLISESGEVKITDFGIAKALSYSTITTTGMFLGSPGYISPEQAEGKKVDNRSDLYSFGVLLFEMLTGKQLFTAETPWAIVNKHINTPAPDISKIVKNIPLHLSRIVTKCLEKNPMDRFSNANEILGVISHKNNNNNLKNSNLKILPKKQTIVKTKKPTTKIQTTSKFQKIWAWNTIILSGVEIVFTLFVYISSIIFIRSYINGVPTSFGEIGSIFFISLSLGLMIGLYLYGISIAEFIITSVRLKKRIEPANAININWLISKTSNLLILIFIYLFFDYFMNGIIGSDINYYILLYPTLSFIILIFYFISSIIYGSKIIKDQKKIISSHIFLEKINNRVNFKIKRVVLSAIGILSVLVICGTVIIVFNLNDNEVLVNETDNLEIPNEHKEEEELSEFTAKRLLEIERDYSKEYSFELKSFEDKDYLEEVLMDHEAVIQLYDLYIWDERWLLKLLNSEYKIDDTIFIIETVKSFKNNDGLRNYFLNYIINKDEIEYLFFFNLEEQSKLFKELHRIQYPSNKVSSLLREIVSNENYHNFYIDNLGMIIFETEDQENNKQLQTDNAAPTLRLEIYEGPLYSEADDACYYRVRAIVTGYPEPVVEFSRDDSSGAWGAKKTQITLLNRDESYLLGATAINAEGSATDALTLSWGCE